MNQAEQPQWLSIGNCPVCEQGMCRVRQCGDGTQRHFYALCDECETVWVEPTTEGEVQYADVENPQCPICAAALYGLQADWAAAEAIQGTPWQAAVQAGK